MSQAQAELLPETASVSPFIFQNNPIRTQLDGDTLWFAAKDVCAALGIKWNGRALSSIPENWQGMRNFLTPSSGSRGGGEQTLKFITEPAVYKLAFRSNKPEADAFTNWIASEVVPSIRKTGQYEAKPAPAPRQRRPRKEVSASRQLALPAHDPVREEIEALLKRVEFYIREVDLAGKEIAKIMARESVNADHIRSRSLVDPYCSFDSHTATSVSFLFSSINFSLSAVRDTVSIRREYGI